MLVARLTLALGVSLELTMIAALPAGDRTPDERISFLTLGSLAVLSIFAAIAIARLPRASFAALGVASLLSALVLGHGVRVLYTLPHRSEGWTPAFVFSVVLAFAACYSAPIAFVTLWPVRTRRRQSSGAESE
jgi:hypothetical protein